MIVTRTERETVLANLKPLEIAELLYMMSGREDFAADLAEHLQNAFVVSTPRHFMMFRAVALDDGRPAWLINSAVSRGDLRELLALLPFKLDAFAFHRHGQGKLRIYNSKRMERLIRHE